MNARDIAEIGNQVFARGISPRKRSKVSGSDVVGFDTEYTSKTNELLAATFSHGDATGFHEIKRGERLTPVKLARWIRELGVETTSVVLVSYFSLAELQHLPVAREAFQWREYGSGSFDCSFRAGDMLIRVLDLARFFDRSGLAQAAEAFGMKKLDWSRASVTRRDLRRKGFREYAVNDAVLAERIFQALRREFLGQGVDIVVSATPARAAADVFRGTLETPIVNEEHRARYCGLRAAWGGRAEVFGRGVFPVLHEYDLTSAYPAAVVAFGLLPRGEDWRECKTWRDVERCKGGVAFAAWKFPDGEEYPSLPVIHRARMIYPLRGAEHVTFAELLKAREHGAEIRLIEAWGFRTGDAALPEFMRGVMEQRKTATGARRVMLKLLANSVIGKLAQRSRRLDLEKLYRYCESEGEDFAEFVRLSADELKTLGFDYGYSVGNCYAPEWNALVCGLVRAQISDAARRFRALYVATDAIWVPDELETPPEGFQLKRSGPAVIARAKLARIGEHVVHHGVHGRREARELVRRMLDEWIPEAGYEVRRPLKIREALSRGLPVGRWIVEKRTASLAWDWKRKLDSSGRTSPWRDAAELDAFRKD